MRVKYILILLFCFAIRSFIPLGIGDEKLFAALRFFVVALTHLYAHISQRGLFFHHIFCFIRLRYGSRKPSAEYMNKKLCILFFRHSIFRMVAISVGFHLPISWNVHFIFHSQYEC